MGRMTALVFFALSVRAQAPVAAPILLDRIAVTVDKQVITESDIIHYLRAAAFLDNKPVDLSGPSRRTAASNLVDQVLMMKEASDSHFVLPTAEDIPALVRQVKMQYSGDASFEDALKKYRITEQELGEHLLAGARALRFTDLRFRPEVEISDADLRSAYDKYVSQWKAAHTEPPPSFEESRANLENLLTDQRSLEALDKWLAARRMQSHIDYRAAAFQ